MTTVVNANLMGISQYSRKEQERSCFFLSKQRVIGDSPFRTARACRKQDVSAPLLSRGRRPLSLEGEGRGEGEKQWFTPSPKPSPRWGEGLLRHPLPRGIRLRECRRQGDAGSQNRGSGRG